MVKITIFGTFHGLSIHRVIKTQGPREDVYEFPSARPFRQTTFSITQVYCPEALVIKTLEFLLRKHERHPSLFSPFANRLASRRLIVLGSRPQPSQSSPQLLFCASSNPLCTGMDGPEPTAIHGARPTANQFLRLGRGPASSAHTLSSTNSVPLGGRMQVQNNLRRWLDLVVDFFRNSEQLVQGSWHAMVLVIIVR